VIRLDAIRIGGRWITSKEALQRFAATLTPTLTGTEPATRTPKARQRASDRAGRKLEDLGV
jgi:hypothetical protein